MISPEAEGSPTFPEMVPRRLVNRAPFRPNFLMLSRSSGGPIPQLIGEALVGDSEQGLKV
jgi:hypothetical protein